MDIQQRSEGLQLDTLACHMLVHDINWQTTLEGSQENTNHAGGAIEEATAQHEPSLPFVDEELPEEDRER